MVRPNRLEVTSDDESLPWTFKGTFPSVKKDRS